MHITQRYRKWFIAAVGGLLAAKLLLVAINYAVDPFGVFQTELFKFTRVVNDMYVKIDYVKNNHDRFDSYILVSSKGYSLNTETFEKYFPSSSFYNLSIKGASVFDHALILDYFLKNGYEIKNVVLFIDISLLSDYYMNADGRKTYEHRLHPDLLQSTTPREYFFDYLNIFPYQAITRKLRENLPGKYPPDVQNLDTGDYYWLREEAKIADIGPDYFSISESLHENEVNRHIRISADKAAQYVRLIENMCKIKNINLTVILLPQNYNKLNEINTVDYLTFLYALSEVTDFWNFSMYSPLALGSENFYDSQHFRSHIGDSIVDEVFSGAEMNNGAFVTRQNRDMHIQTLLGQFDWADQKWN